MPFNQSLMVVGNRRATRRGARGTAAAPQSARDDTAVLSLAIGSARHDGLHRGQALLFQPPPGVAAPSRLVDIGGSRSGAGSGPALIPITSTSERATTIDAVYAYSRFPQSIGVAGPVRVLVLESISAAS